MPRNIQRQRIADSRGSMSTEVAVSDRLSGILLHVTSLPSYGGVGDFGPAAYAFVDFLAAAKQRLWQVLPLSPTGYGGSPYSALSAFAGNPLLISLERLAEDGWISADRLGGMVSAAFDLAVVVEILFVRSLRSPHRGGVSSIAMRPVQESVPRFSKGEWR